MLVFVFATLPHTDRVSIIEHQVLLQLEQIVWSYLQNCICARYYKIWTALLLKHSASNIDNRAVSVYAVLVKQICGFCIWLHIQYKLFRNAHYTPKRSFSDSKIVCMYAVQVGDTVDKNGIMLKYISEMSLVQRQSHFAHNNTLTAAKTK